MNEKTKKAYVKACAKAHAHLLKAVRVAQAEIGQELSAKERELTSDCIQETQAVIQLIWRITTTYT